MTSSPPKRTSRYFFYDKNNKTLGEVSKNIILAFQYRKKLSYNLLQLFAIGDNTFKEREKHSFDHRLYRLKALGFIVDVVEKKRDDLGVIQASRFYCLTDSGRSLLRNLQIERREREIERKRGNTLTSNVGGDRWSNIKKENNDNN